MRKPLIRALVICLALCFGTQFATSAQSTPTPRPTPTRRPATIQLWHSWQGADADALTAQIALFNTAYPEITIQPRAIEGDLRMQVLDAIKSDIGPDLFVGPSDWLAGLVDARRVAGLGSRLNDTDRAQLAPVAWKMTTSGDASYGIPESLDTVALYYNASLVKDEELPKTAADLLATKPAIMFDFYTTAGLYFGRGGGLFDVNGLPSLRGSSAALLDYLKSLQEAFALDKAADLFLPGRIPVVADRRFRDGQTPFLVDGSWKAADMRVELGDKLRVVTLPPIAEGKQWTTLIRAQVYYLNINARESDAATLFLKFLLTEESQRLRTAVPGRTPTNFKAVSEANAVFLAQVQTGTPVPLLNGLWNVLDQAVADVTIRGIDAEIAMRTAMDAADRLALPKATPTP